MWSLFFAVFVAFQALIAGLLVNRAPFMMATTPHTTKAVWADQPMQLIPTPQYETKQTDLFTTGATHMCLLHNSILRGFNSIYLQAPHVHPHDKAAFVGYALTWFKFVKSHHDDEEANLFTKIEEVLDDKEVFAETHEEHDSFMAGLTEYHQYLANLPSPSALDAAELVRIMDSFREPFEQHFHHEISVIAALASHPKAPAPDSPEAAAASDVFKAWGKKTVSKAGTADVVPFFLLNLDGTFEDGAWAAWPPMPAFIRWGLLNLAGSWYGGYWKFSSCDAQGRPRALHALPSAKA
ncbi:hypothetical protein S40285_01070 [Stachybotrys chlorohalonatus IBT 40285]|uniref:Hemerythrin-like domain-containing protein n=1 Tax=Stachybotrys chlorohalonatus (strain IBT 40285) TaxID=1283841 RepID=A0A084QKC1_STAC4|nr:hypothetical protein S40285_01070 [Stachybotrys chlorohalonata IBT 40285]